MKYKWSFETKWWRRRLPYLSFPFWWDCEIVGVNPNQEYDRVDETLYDACSHLCLSLFPGPGLNEFIKYKIKQIPNQSAFNLPSILRLVSRLPVRLRSKCGAGRSTGVVLVWYIVRPEYRNLEPNFGNSPDFSLFSGVISRKNVWCSTHAFHSFLALRWSANLNPIVDSYCSNSPGRILM